MKEELKQKIKDKTLVCGTVGIGYVGLQLAVEKAKAGFKTIGFDVVQERLTLLTLVIITLEMWSKRILLILFAMAC